MFELSQNNYSVDEASSPDSESVIESKFKPRWSEVDCANSGKRWMHCSILFDKYMITYAGGNGREALDDLVALNLETNTWKKIEILGQKPAGRYGHTGNLWKNDTLVVFGGQISSSNIIKETLLVKFDSEAMDSVTFVVDQATAYPDIGRTRHSASIYENSLYIFGGKDEKKLTAKTLLRLNLITLAWETCVTTGFQPDARHGHSSIVNKDKMYVFGGYYPQQISGVYLNEVLRLDFGSLRWDKLEPKGVPPIARDAICVQEHDQDIYIFGGRGKDGSFNDIFSYDMFENTWNQIQPRNVGPTPRISYSAVVYKNDLIIWGGGAPSGCYSKIFRLKLKKDENENMGRLERLKRISNNDAKIMKLYAFNEQFSDVTFIVEGEKFNCHKVILSSQCKYFENMFLSSMIESQAKEIQVPDVESSTFQALIKYIYGQDVELDEKLGKDLFRLSDMWSITKLREKCEKYLMHIISLENFREIAELAESLNTPKLMDVVLDFATKNLKGLEEASTLYSLPNTLLVKALFKAVGTKE